METEQWPLDWRFAQRIALLVLIFIAVGRLFPPNDWATAQYLFSYDLGFQRRALFGEVLQWFWPDGFSTLDTHRIAFGTSLVAILSVLGFLSSAFRAETIGSTLLLAFVSSIGVATFISMTGYLDTVLVVFAVLCLSLPTSIFGTILRGILVILGCLVHENFLPYFVLLICLDVWLKSPQETWIRRSLIAAAPLVVSSLTVWVLFQFGTHAFEDLDLLLASMSERALDFEMDTNVAEPVVSFPKGYDTFDRYIWTTASYKFFLFGFGAFGLVSLVLTAIPIMRACFRQPLPVALGFIGTAIAPMSLVFVAYDISRFIAVAHVALFLTAAVLLRHAPGFGDQLSRTFGLRYFLVLIMIFAPVQLRDFSGTNPVRGIPFGFLEQSGWGRPAIAVE